MSTRSLCRNSRSQKSTPCFQHLTSKMHKVPNLMLYRELEIRISQGLSMSTDAQIAANRINAQASSGPRTAAGRSRVSRNAISSGLYSSRDFVRPEEHDLYAEFCAGFEINLAPEGAVEQTLAAEIIHAAWRLRRCSVVEAAMTCVEDGESDPMLDHPQQQPVDRARAQAHRLFHRTTAELRRIQTERQFRNEFLHDEVDT